MTLKKLLISFVVFGTAIAIEQASSQEKEAVEKTSKATMTAEQESLPASLLPLETLVHIFQFDRRNGASFILVSKEWRNAVLLGQTMERKMIEAWPYGISPFSLEETKKGFYKFMFYLPTSHPKDGTSFSQALRAEMGRFLELKQEQIDNWKVELKAIGCSVVDEPTVFQDQATFCSLRHIFIAYQHLKDDFLFFGGQKDLGKLVLDIASLATKPITLSKDEKMSHQILSLFKTSSTSKELSLFKHAGSIYRGWRSLQPTKESLCDHDLKSGFGRFILSTEMTDCYNREKYQVEGQTYLLEQLGQLQQELLKYLARAERAHNKLLISLIE